MTPRTLTMASFYKLVSETHPNIFDPSYRPDLSEVDTAELSQIMAACHGARWAVGVLSAAARDELVRRNEEVWNPPLRLVEDPDPLKNRERV